MLLTSCGYHSNNTNNNRIERRNSRFFTISSLRREPSPTRTLKWPGRNGVQITCNTSRAYYAQHVVVHATWYERTAQLLNLTEFKSHLFELYFIARTMAHPLPLFLPSSNLAVTFLTAQHTGQKVSIDPVRGVIVSTSAFLSC